MLNDSGQTLWNNFSARHKLSEKQGALFKDYYARIVETNALHNITAITDLASVTHYHFDDSLASTSFIDFSQLKSIADIGTGAGFPGLPLKIMYPHLAVVLIEVQAKKRAFLEALATEWQLTDVIISELDWRTFLRKTADDIDLFCARASVQPEELIRVFKPSSHYNKASLVYWASQTWEPSASVAHYIQEKYVYRVGDKVRNYILLADR